MSSLAPVQATVLLNFLRTMKMATAGLMKRTWYMTNSPSGQWINKQIGQLTVNQTISQGEDI